MESSQESEPSRTGRREFIKGAALAAGAAWWISQPRAQAAPRPAAEGAAAQAVAAGAARSDEIPKRKLGKTGAEVSIIGIGGSAFADAKSKDEAIRIIHEAIDAGVTFMDNAWEYHQGRSEEWMGAALKGRRDKVFLMTKVCTHGRDKKVAMRQLEDSLRRLGTDHLDLWQIHEVIYWNDPDLAFRPGGAVEALDEARKQGKTRFIGFTGHKDPHIHLKMLAHKHPFDTCQLPLNCFDATFQSFEQLVLPELHKQGIAPIGMKSMTGHGEPVKKGAVNPQEALRYAMSLPVATTVSGIDSLQVLHQNLEVARGFKPMTPEEMKALREKVQTVAADGRFELYKVSLHFDGRVGRDQHGFPMSS